MPQAVGGTNVYPSLESMAQLFRSRINDDAAGATDTPGEGSIAYDNAPFIMPFMNSAMEDLFSDLRIVRDPTLIFDNYIVEGIPVINGPYGSAAPAPETQVYLGYNGFFDGTQMWPAFKLPIYTRDVTRLWERITGSANNFVPMSEAQFGLPPVQQGSLMREWEYRGDSIWMPGALQQVDLRIRGTLNFVDYINNVDYSVSPTVGTLNFSNTFFPIQDSKNSIVAKMLVQYAQRFSPESLAAAQADETMKVKKLKQEIALRRQTVQYSRGDFGGGADDFWASASQL